MKSFNCKKDSIEFLTRYRRADASFFSRNPLFSPNLLFVTFQSPFFSYLLIFLSNLPPWNTCWPFCEILLRKQQLIVVAGQWVVPSNLRAELVYLLSHNMAWVDWQQLSVVQGSLVNYWTMLSWLWVGTLFQKYW